MSTNNANKRRRAGLNLSVVAYSDSRAVPVDKTLTLAFALENICVVLDILEAQVTDLLRCLGLSLRMRLRL